MRIKSSKYTLEFKRNGNISVCDLKGGDASGSKGNTILQKCTDIHNLEIERCFFLDESHVVELMVNKPGQLNGHKQYSMLVIFDLDAHTRKKFLISEGFHQAQLIESRYLVLATDARILRSEVLTAKMAVIDLNPDNPKEIFFDNIEHLSIGKSSRNFRADATYGRRSNVPKDLTCQLFRNNNKNNKGNYLHRFAQLPDGQMAVFEIDEDRDRCKFVVWNILDGSKTKEIFISGMPFKREPCMPSSNPYQPPIKPVWYHLSDWEVAVIDTSDPQKVHTVNLLTNELAQSDLSILQGHRSLACDLVHSQCLPPTKRIFDLTQGLFATTHAFCAANADLRNPGSLEVTYTHIWNIKTRKRILIPMGMNTDVLNVSRKGKFITLSFMEGGETYVEDWHINKQRNTDPTPDFWQRQLFVAAFTGNVNLAKCCLEHGEAEINALHITGFSALHFAIAQFQLKMVELLLNHGADVNKKSTSPKQLSPLSLANTCCDPTHLPYSMRFISDIRFPIKNEQKEVALLIKDLLRGKKPIPIPVTSSMNQNLGGGGAKKMVRMPRSVKSFQVSTKKEYILNELSEVNFIDYPRIKQAYGTHESRNMQMIQAVVHNDSSQLREALANNANISYSSPIDRHADFSSITALEICCGVSHVDEVWEEGARILVEHAIEKGIVIKGKSALDDGAIQRKNIELIRILMGNTHAANELLVKGVLFKNCANIKRALKEGADVNYHSRIFKSTALYIACRKLNFNAVLMLLNAKADPNIKCSKLADEHGGSGRRRSTPRFSQAPPESALEYLSRLMESCADKKVPAQILALFDR